jgi:hypothetical protein
MLEQLPTPSVPVFIKDLGMKFPTEKSKKKIRFGLFKCRCENNFEAQMNNIKKGSTTSCGCFSKERHTKHGMSSHRLYRIICGIIQRCVNQNHKHFINYGGRGITVYDEWTNNKQSFFNWALANGYKDGLSIDRIDNDSGYSPENCRWVTTNVQARNTRLLRANNTSGYRGVTWHKKSNKWVAQISINGNAINLGYFNSKIEAASTYDKYVLDNNLEHTINNI